MGQGTRVALRAAALLLLGGCGRDGTAGLPPGADPGAATPRSDPPGVLVPPPPLPGPQAYPRPCSDLHADGALPTFELELAQDAWAGLEAEFRAGSDAETYYPAVFRYGSEVVRDARVRLRGNNSKCGDKMQFAISFNQVNPQGRFHGLRRLNLDHGGCQLFTERLALSWLREDVGLPAACANHARLVVNGRYYGLFVNIEHVNKDFLQRHFGDADEGNLYKSGHRLRTNESNPDTSDVEAFRKVRDLSALDLQADVDEAVLEWAAEATLPTTDNYWLNGWNYYLYHHPTRGFLWIPTDMDQAFLGASSSDLFFPASPQPHASVVLNDAAGRARYLAAVERARGAFDARVLEARLERWWAQVQDAARTDPHARVDRSQVDALEQRVRARASWLGGWRPPQR